MEGFSVLQFYGCFEVTIGLGLSVSVHAERQFQSHLEHAPTVQCVLSARWRLLQGSQCQQKDKLVELMYVRVTLQQQHWDTCLRRRPHEVLCDSVERDSLMTGRQQQKRLKCVHSNSHDLVVFVSPIPLVHLSLILTLACQMQEVSLQSW